MQQTQYWHGLPNQAKYTCYEALLSSPDGLDVDKQDNLYRRSKFQDLSYDRNIYVYRISLH